MRVNLIDEFYELNKTKYNISKEEFTLICKTPFTMLSEVIKRGSMHKVRLQYLGIFSPSRLKVKYNLEQLEKSYSLGNISTKKYLERKEMLLNYEKNN